MAHLVVRVVGDVLRHVAVEVLKRRDVSGVFAVDAAELVVLLPEIRLDDLRGREELQDRNIAAREPAPGCAGGAPDAGLDASCATSGRAFGGARSQSSSQSRSHTTATGPATGMGK